MENATIKLEVVDPKKLDLYMGLLQHSFLIYVNGLINKEK